VLFIALFGFHRKITVEGVLAPDLGLLPVRSPQAGIVTARLVEQDQIVDQGTPLFRISAERASVRVGETDAALSALLAARRGSLIADGERIRQQGAERRRAKLARAELIKDDARRITEELSLQKSRVELAVSEVERYRIMQQQGYVSSAALQDKQAGLLDQRLKLAELLGRRAESDEELQNLLAEAADDRTQTLREIDANRRSVAELDGQIAENEVGRELLIRAPLQGAISNVAADVGEQISASQTLAAIVPAQSHLEALLYASSSARGFIQPGMDVLLRYESFPFQKFGLAKGRIKEVADASIETAGSAPTGTVGSDPVYRVKVELERQDVLVADGSLPLKAGMRLQASVVLEERKLYEWVLEPLFILKGRL
jgi:membrane fusion protein